MAIFSVINLRRCLLPAQIAWWLVAIGLVPGLVSCSGSLTTLPTVVPGTATAKVLLLQQTRPAMPALSQPSPTLKESSSQPQLTSTPNRPSPSPTIPPSPTETSVPLPIRLGVLGDFGQAGKPLADVAALIFSWQPDYILTVGDNNYPSGSAETIDDNIGQYFSSYIAPYTGNYGKGGEINRFFPTLGNHDWDTSGAKPYFDYFTLPGNERYYDLQLGVVHAFLLDSDSREPDGVSRLSIQAEWLRQGLLASTAPWKLILFHHAPYSSGYQGPVTWMRWPFQEWGASAVLAGHDHVYERTIVDGLVYFTTGVGGGAIYPFLEKEPGSQMRYNDDYGAILIEAYERQISFWFINRQGDLIDTFLLQK